MHWVFDVICITPFGTLPLLVFVTVMQHKYIYVSTFMSNIHEAIQTSLLVAVDGFGLEREMPLLPFSRVQLRNLHLVRSQRMFVRHQMQATLARGRNSIKQSPQQLPSTGKQP